MENTGKGNYAIAIYNYSAAPRLTHVTATALGSSTNYGVLNYSSSPTMINVTVTASGGSTNTGVYNYLGPLTIHHSVISGTTSIDNNGGTVKVAASQLLGPVMGGGFTCVGAYDVNFAALDASCE